MAAATRCAEQARARMAAWRVHAYGALDELRLDEARVPRLRAGDELLVRVHHSSLNPLDVAMIGGYGRAVLGALRGLAARGEEELPLVCGRDFVGRVELAAPGARWRRGALVWGVLPPHWQGAHAQYVVTRDRWVDEAPRRDTAAACGALYAGLTALAARRAAGGAAGRGRRALVLGLGGVGAVLAQLLARDGAQVVVGCSRELQAAARAAGAAAALDRHAPDYQQQLRDAGPYDAVFDCAGLGGAAAGGLRARRFVTVTSPLLRLTDRLGLAAGTAAAAAELARQNLAAGGAVRWAFVDVDPAPEQLRLLRLLVDSAEVRVPVERAWGWRDAAAAYARTAQGHARGKLLLDFTQD